MNIPTAHWERDELAPSEIELFHGSDHIIDNPTFLGGSDDNDYGNGFYTTKDLDKAKSWAVIMGKPEEAVVNRYILNTEGLSVCDLGKFGVLAWCAEIAFHRGSDSVETLSMREKFIEKYKIETDFYDVIIGYRADDSYMSIVEAFFKNQLTINEMEGIFRIGQLGEQVFIKSKKAFSNLDFAGSFSVTSDYDKYLQEDSHNRSTAESWLIKRINQINIEGYRPESAGLIARDVIRNKYIYNPEYGFYELGTEDHNL